MSTKAFLLQHVPSCGCFRIRWPGSRIILWIFTSHKTEFVNPHSQACSCCPVQQGLVWHVQCGISAPKNCPFWEAALAAFLQSESLWILGTNFLVSVTVYNSNLCHQGKRLKGQGSPMDVQHPYFLRLEVLYFQIAPWACNTMKSTFTPIPSVPCLSFDSFKALIGDWVSFLCWKLRGLGFGLDFCLHRWS